MSQSERSRIASEGGRARWGYRDSDEDDRSYSARDQDYDDYGDYDDIEDEGYERGGYGRSGGRGGEGRGYNLSEREYRDYDEDEGYQEENVRGRRGFAAMDPDEQREIASMGGRASHGGGRGRSSSRSDEDYGYEDEDESDDDYSSSSRSSGRGSSSGGRGFAGMSDEEHRRISAKGGRASHGGGRSESSRGRQSQTSNRSRSTSSRSARH